MKILVASHTYIVKLNCEKFRTITQLYPDAEVTIVVPQKWSPGGVQQAKIVETEPWQINNFRVVPIPNFSQNNQGLLTFKSPIINLLKSFKPNIIQVEQGVKSFGYAQLILLNRLLNLQAKNCFFTWWNIPYRSKFPVSVLENFNLKNTDGLVAGNQDAVNILQDHGYQGRYCVLPQLGVDEQLFSPQSQPELATKLGITEEEFVIGFVGRFVPEKGILTLIQAVSQLKHLSWKLLLLGRGDLKDTILSEAKKAGISERLILIESVPHDQVPCYINLMNVLVLPSQTNNQFKTLTSVGWKEQFGHVLIEAMACKVPVIGSDSGEIPNVIGEAGLIFPEQNTDALKKAISQLIEQSELAQNLAHWGYQRVIENYTNTALAKQHYQFYRNLLDG